MDLHDCVEFATNYPNCALATVDGDQPRVRTFLLWFADETGFYFVTFSAKDVSRQLKANPRVELCFFNNPDNFRGMNQLRISGRAVLVEDETLRGRALRERAFLEQAVGEPLGPTLEVFRIGSGEARFWTVSDFLKEPETESLRF